VSVLLYRGPLERARLRLVLKAAYASLGASHFIWLRPGRRRRQHDEVSDGDREFLSLPTIDKSTVLDGDARSAPGVVGQLRALVGKPGVPVLVVGFSAMPYARAMGASRYVWFINGVPEERLCHRNTMAKRLQVRALWAGARWAGDAGLVVTVSRPMSDLVATRLRTSAVFVVPNTTNLKAFEKGDIARERVSLTYLGSGAPWQAITQLARVWGAVYALKPGVRFRVVSRDHRTRVLGTEIPSSSIEFVEAADLGEVARLLSESSLGFVIRPPNLVNRVSFPTKFAEYLAAGVPVVVSDIGWDLSEIVSRTGCGLLVGPSESPHAIARRVESYLDAAPPAGRSSAARRAAAELGEDVWAGHLAKALGRWLDSCFSP
jgi:glycosyltransferase involved in cell wall biosynthesis